MKSIKTFCMKMCNLEVNNWLPFLVHCKVYSTL